jgi:hypothetical protein
MRPIKYWLPPLALISGMALSVVARADNSLIIPPSVDLLYSIKASQKGLSVSGEALVKWHVGEQKNKPGYTLQTETRVMLFGKILEANSFGNIDEFGVAPDKYVEKRFGKPATTTSFDRAANLIRFTEASVTYPIKGGEQDRSSATWQLVALARAAGDKFKVGSEWKMFVAGRRDAEPWSFKVTGVTTLNTALGEFSTFHVIKAPPPDSKDQQLEIWLAPKLEWYPVRLKFTDADGDTVDQTISSMTKQAKETP